MSALHAGVISSKIVWIHNGDAESKGGVNWGAGNDTTGDGSPEAPYLTELEALKQIRVYEGQLDVTSDWELRYVTDDDVAQNYGQVNYTAQADLPRFEGYHLIISGWLKGWGAFTRGKWSTIAQRPIVDEWVRASTGAAGGQFGDVVFVDISFTGNTSPARLVDLRLSNGDFTGPYAARLHFYGCVFDSNMAPVTNGLGLRMELGTGINVGGVNFTACFFKRALAYTSAVGGNSGIYYFANCAMIPRVNESAIFVYRSGTFTSTKRTLNCIIAPKGAGTFAYHNIQASTAAQTENIRHHNRYWLRDSAQFFRRVGAGGSDVAAFVGLGGNDDESSEGNPLITAEDNPTVTNASPSLDKGGKLGGIWNACLDFTGNKFHDRDILGFPWGDSEDASTLASADGNSLWTHRAIGCHQNELGMVPGLAQIAWPIGIIAVQTDFVAALVNPDPDQNGTVQFRVLQADNAEMNSNLVIKDSCPLHVTASNNKINFKEDGGLELTATLTPGLYDTQSLMAEIKTQLEAAGTGTYAVTYDSGTELVTVEVSGAVTNVQLLFATGTDVANSARVFLGFRGLDTVNGPSAVGDDRVLENFYDAALAYEYSSDYDGSSDPASSGIWAPVGTGIPSDSGVEGTDGVLATPGSTRYVRVDLGTTNPLDLKYHAIQFWNGTLKSQDEVV